MQIFAKLIVVSIVFLSTCFVQPEAVEDKRIAEVVGVNDGDTLTVVFKHDGVQRKIRLATIDAPEFNQPFGRKSRQNLSELAFRKNAIIIGKDVDRYQRIVGEVLVDGVNLNVAQIKQGYAWHYKRHQNQQTPAERLIYSKAEEFARENKSGLWRDKNPMPPWEFRTRKGRTTEDGRPLKLN
ncbi:MAG: thermonuclease family protein [Pyrinomonadaceae bacterium]|nr:thermonuclease family protein [Pyrinomonadaceae bacterium]